MTKFLLASMALLGASIVQAADMAPPQLEDFKWVARPIVVFADSAQDPRLLHQLAEFEGDMEELAERDVEVLVDTTPGEKTPLRQKFRPRDFNIVLIDKDGSVIYRKPNPVTVSEIIRLIDRTPMRQEEIEARRNITN